MRIFTLPKLSRKQVSRSRNSEDWESATQRQIVGFDRDITKFSLGYLSNLTCYLSNLGTWGYLSNRTKLLSKFPGYLSKFQATKEGQGYSSNN